MDIAPNSQESLVNGSGFGDGKVSEALTMILEESGGFSGIMKKFNDSGLKNVMHSWISKEPNLAINPSQVKTIFGETLISRAANKVGFSSDELCERLSVEMPGLIDKLSPEGALPEGIWTRGLDKAKELFGLTRH